MRKRTFHQTTNRRTPNHLLKTGKARKDPRESDCGVRGCLSSREGSLTVGENPYRNPRNALNEKGERVRGENYWAQVPLTMVGAGLTGAAWAVWLTLDGMQGNKAYCYPSIQYLCTKTNQTPNTVKRAISSLENAMYLLVERQRGSKNRYYVINGARRSGEELAPCGSKLLKKPRKNNLASKGGSKSGLQVGSNVFKSRPKFEPVIKSRNKSSLDRATELHESAQSPLRRIQQKRIEGFIENFGRTTK